MLSLLLPNGDFRITMSQEEGVSILSRMRQLQDSGDLDSITERLLDEIESCIDEDEEDFEDDEDEDDEIITS